MNGGVVWDGICWGRCLENCFGMKFMGIVENLWERCTIYANSEMLESISF